MYVPTPCVIAQTQGAELPLAFTVSLLSFLYTHSCGFSTQSMVSWLCIALCKIQKYHSPHLGQWGCRNVSGLTSGRIHRQNPGYQSNTSATGQVSCPQFNGLCGSTVSPPYLLCRHWCPGLQLMCSSLIFLDLCRSSSCLPLQLAMQMLREELRNDTAWFPSQPARRRKLHRLIWAQERRNRLQPFGFKV